MQTLEKNINPEDTGAIIAAQKERLDKLQSLNPVDTILIKVLEGGIPKGADPDLYKWIDFKQVWQKVTTPIYTRGILLNEIMIDPDAENWEDIRDELRKLQIYCNKENIPYTMGFSGGKGIHFSIIFGGISAGSTEATTEIYNKVEEFCIDARKVVRSTLLSELAKRANVDLEKLGLDRKKINFRTSSKGSQIREFGTIRAPGKYKTLITEIPDNKPEAGELPLVFPEDVKVWNIKDTEFNDIAIDAIRQEITKQGKAEECTPIPDEKFKDIKITEFPCIAKLYNAGIKKGRYDACLAVVLMGKKCGISKTETEKNLQALCKTFPDISQADADLRIQNSLNAYGSEHKFSCTELKETFPELNICDFQNCPIREKLNVEKQKQEEKEARETITEAIKSIKPSPDTSIRIQQVKEFILEYLLNIDENLAEELLITKIKKPFDFNNSEFSLIKRFLKAEKKKQKERKLERERASSEYTPITFGDTADNTGNAVSALYDDFKKYHAPVFNLGGQIYIYNGRIYEATDSKNADMRKFFYRQAELHKISISPNNVKNVIKRVEDENTLNPEDLTISPERIVVKNGILNLLTGELSDHDPNEMHVAELNITYDPSIPISQDFDNYLKTAFKGDEWEINLFQEMFGYCLLREYKFEVFFFLVGNGGNGRTVATNLLNTFLGNENVCSKKLQEISNPKDPYSLMSLHGKLANICGETGIAEIVDLSNLKQATGRDKIEARLPYKPWVRFYNYAKMIFSMNQVPVIRDSTRGRIRRMKIIDFRNSFIAGVNADEELEDKLKTPESLTGILNWAMEGLHRLLEKGKFSDIRTEAQIAIDFDRKSNPVKHFVLDHIDEADVILFDKSKVTFGRLLEAYTAYMKKHNLPSLEPRILATQVKYECERAGMVVRQGRDRYKKGEPREDFLKGIVLCGLEELGLKDPNAEPQTEIDEFVMPVISESLVTEDGEEFDRAIGEDLNEVYADMEREANSLP